MTHPTHEAIVKKICEELVALEVESNAPFSAATNMTTDMKIDSLDIMELVFNLEEAFDASVPVNELSGVYTIGELANLVQKNIA